MLESICFILRSILMRKVCFDWWNLSVPVNLDCSRDSVRSAGEGGAAVTGERHPVEGHHSLVHHPEFIYHVSSP